MKCKVKQFHSPDHTFALLTEGYHFIGNRMKKYNTDIFKTYILGRKVICISGEEAVKIMYNPEMFQRAGATPKRVQKTLFGEKAIQTMDGTEHLHRKQHFMSLMTTVHEMQLANLVKMRWEDRMVLWEQAGEIILFQEAKEVLCQAACEWAGVPLQEHEMNAYITQKWVYHK